MDLPSTAPAKQNLLSVCERLKNENGLFIVDKASRDQLTQAVEDLESRSEPPGANAWDDSKRNLVGDWTLLCTTTTNTPAVDRSQIPAFLAGPLQDLRSRVTRLANTYLKVQQRIRTDPNSGDVTRVDHVIEYAPPRSVKDLLRSSNVDGPSIPDAIAGLNLNPLDISKSKLVLVHKAAVSTTSSTLVTKLTLQSVVVNVAGTSSVLDPQGKDVASLNVASLNVPSMFDGASDFVNSDSFETTYMDDNLRISRGKLGLVDQLRVFVKQTNRGDETMRTTETDVDEAVDPEFVYDDETTDSVDGNDHEGQDDVSPSDY